jgi:hypothetical protein
MCVQFRKVILSVLLFDNPGRWINDEHADWKISQKLTLQRFALTQCQFNCFGFRNVDRIRCKAIVIEKVNICEAMPVEYVVIMLEIERLAGKNVFTIDLIAI